MREPFYDYATQTSILHTFMSSMEVGCERCTLACEETKSIVYRGNPKSDIMLIGEAPGKIEQEQRKPFVGPTGQLLDKMMDSIGLDTEKDLMLTNAVYCRPTASDGSGKQNYTPKDTQVNRCRPFTEALIKIIKPKIIIACGRVALQQLTRDKKISIGKVEGKWMEYKYSVPFPPPTRGNRIESIPMFVITHPAALLYLGDGTEEQRKKKLQVWQYLQEFRDSWKEKRNDEHSI